MWLVHRLGVVLFKKEKHEALPLHALVIRDKLHGCTAHKEAP